MSPDIANNHRFMLPQWRNRHLPSVPSSSFLLGQLGEISEHGILDMAKVWLKTYG